MKETLFILTNKNLINMSHLRSRLQCLFIIATLLFSDSLTAQSVLPGEDEMGAFFDTKTLVVLESGMFSTFNIEIKEAMEKYWKITPYDFITADEFKEKMSDSNFSFILLTQSFFEKDKNHIHYDFLNLVMGAKYKSLSELPEIGSIPLSYSEGDQEYYGYKLEVIIKFIQNRATELRESGADKSMKYLDYYNDLAKDVKTKKLVIYEGDLQTKLRTASAVGEFYDHDFDIVSADEMAELVSAGTEDIYFVHVVGPEETHRSGMSFKMIFKLSDASMVYYNKHKISEKKPAGFGASDFKRLNK